MRRLPQIVLIGATIPLAWLLMQIVHEAGHALMAGLTGGNVRRVILHPLTISRTDFDANPHPLVVCWAGPVLGVLLPIALWTMTRIARSRGEFWARFFAGFCLIANGAYLAVGSRDRVGDAGDLLTYGSPIWMLWLFGAITIPTGLHLWDGLGPSFGLGTNADSIRWNTALLVTILLVTVIGLECWLSECC